MGILEAIRQRIRDANAQTAELKESARSTGKANELARLIDRHQQGLIGDKEFQARKHYLEQ